MYIHCEQLGGNVLYTMHVVGLSSVAALSPYRRCGEDATRLHVRPCLVFCTTNTAGFHRHGHLHRKRQKIYVVSSRGTCQVTLASGDATRPVTRMAPYPTNHDKRPPGACAQRGGKATTPPRPGSTSPDSLPFFEASLTYRIRIDSRIECIV